jgi:hypothetical protein
VSRKIVVEIELASEDDAFDMETEMSAKRLETALWQTFHRLFRVTHVETTDVSDEGDVRTGDRREDVFGGGEYVVLSEDDDGRFPILWLTPMVRSESYAFRPEGLVGDRLISRGNQVVHADGSDFDD